MKTITIELPDNCEVQIVKKESKFKKGDIITSCTGLIAIFEKLDVCPSTGNVVVYFSTLYSPSFGLEYINNINFGIGKEKDCDFASKEEREILINALKKEVSKNSRNAKIVLKEVFNIDCTPVIRTYQDLIDNDIELCGFFITNQSWINHINGRALNSNKLIAASEKVAKSMLAMAMISQLIPYYGGEIDNEMWTYPNTKYVIRKVGNRVIADNTEHSYHFLAFHTEEQRNKFIKYNEQLVKDYLMID